MGGTALALPRWLNDPFYQTVIRGHVLDIGAGHDPLPRYARHFPQVTAWTCLDHNPPACEDGARWIAGRADDLAAIPRGETFDLVYSSHCLEHVWNPTRALTHWWDRVAPGGHLFVIVPSWAHYERCIWPPRINTDHKTAWTLHLPESPFPFIRGLVDEMRQLGGDLIRASTLDTGFNPNDRTDQTRTGTCECGHEAIMRKAA